MDTKRTLLISLVLLLISGVALPQQIFQTVKGTVTDADSRMPVPGATVVVKDSDPLIGATTDINGKFRMEKVPVGRQTIVISFMGYETVTLTELVVGSGKEIVLDISLKEKVTNLSGVEIKAAADGDDAVNRMVIAGANQINMEQANRYAGGVDDPSRLASAFAGVASGLASNGIVIRGNSAKGLLWRLEDVEITNPNHYADLVVFGAGGLCALSSQMLANSDFYTGAFTAEYSNALSGVFDMRLRSGNSDKREYALGLSSNGIDVSSEGPFRKGRNATYLFNYRFSTLTLLQPILPPEAGTLNYQDLSWKINMPVKKCVWSFWGFAAMDSQNHDAVADSSERELESDALQYSSKSFSGATGLNFRAQLGSNSYLSSVASLSGFGVDLKLSGYNEDNFLHPDHSIQSSNYSISNRTFFNHKFSARHTIRSGFVLSQSSYDINVLQAFSDSGLLVPTVAGNGNATQASVFSQSKISFSDKTEMVAGIHGVYYNFNNEYCIEPRISIRHKTGALSAVSFATGLYSRPEPLNIYLIESSNGEFPNSNLPVTKAFHAVAGYKRILSENLQLKIEPYYQYIYDVPVAYSGSFSMINAEAVYLLSDSLKTGGTGRNIGIDFTLERNLSGQYYYLFTASLFDSRYVDGQGVERNSRFNKHYVVNLLGGYEWKTGRGKNNLLNLNLRLCLMGGDRLEVVDLPASLAMQQVVYNDDKVFENKKPDSQILSFALNYRINKPHHASVWTLQIINVLGEKDYEGYSWDAAAGAVVENADPYLIPAISYKIEW